MHQTDKHYVYELDGLGRKMPVTFTVFTISAFALMGVPGLAGFISKWYLCQAATLSCNVLAYVGIMALLISALLTAIYMLTIVVRAFLPTEGFNYETVSGYKDPNLKMLIPLCIFTVVIIVFGVYSGPFVQFFNMVANGLL